VQQGVVLQGASGVGEIEFKNGALVVCHKSKWEPGSIEDLNTPPYFPARVDPQKSKKIIRLGYSAFKAIGGRGYGRVDMREDSSGRLFVLEVNPNPDISPGAGFAISFRAKNIAYEAIIRAIIEDAIARKESVNIDGKYKSGERSGSISASRDSECLREF
jgi:D-alanine-D-alanine ligase-like ATP-grasp enzyme